LIFLVLIFQLRKMQSKRT